MAAKATNLKLEAVSAGQILPHVVLFLQEVREKHGFLIGTSEYITVQKLLNTLMAKGNLIYNAADILQYLTPVLCKSGEEQQKITACFIDWIGTLGIVEIEDKKQADLVADVKTQEKTTLKWILPFVFMLLLIYSIFIALDKIYSKTNETIPEKPGQETQIKPIEVPPTIPPWLFILIPFSVFGVLALRSMWEVSAYTFLKRRFPEIDEKFSFVKLPKPIIADDSLPRRLKNIATKFNRRIETTVREIDFENTVRATTSNSGLVELRYRPVQYIPEYLILVDKLAAQDHQAVWTENILNTLEKYDIRYDLLFFNRDIRSFYKPNSSKAYEFSQLHGLFPNRILLIFSTGNGLLNPFTRRIEQELVDHIDAWERKVLFSPEHIQRQQSKYQEFFSHGFLIFPLSISGLDDFVITDQMLSRQPNQRHRDSHFLPDLLYGDFIKWVDRHQPEEEVVYQLLDDLQSKYLGANGYLWLSACAVYPDLQYELTVYLGQNLSNTQGNNAVFSSTILTRLMQLPWFRQGYMPDWLRKVLIQSMPAEHAKRVKDLIYNWFFAALEAKEKLGELPYEIAISNEMPKGKLKRRIFNLIAKKAEPQSMLREYIFAGFMQDKLSFPVPNVKILNNPPDTSAWVQKIRTALQSNIYFDALLKAILVAAGIGVGLWGLSKGYEWYNSQPTHEYVTAVLWGGIVIAIFLSLYLLLRSIRELPSGIKYLMINEVSERFSYYGLRVILTTFLVNQFYNRSGSTDPGIVQAAEAAANAKAHVFNAIVFLLPIFGGMIADWFWGTYKTILRFSIISVTGYFIVVFSSNNESLFTAALLLIALGTGVVKSAVSANIGDQLRLATKHFAAQSYAIFYVAINIGSVFSILLIPYLNRYYGPTTGFAVPAIVMVFGLFIFWEGRHQYRNIPVPAFDPNRVVILVTSFISLAVSYIYFSEIQHDNIAVVLGAWLASILVLALIFRKQWFAKPGNFVGINLYALLKGSYTAATKEYGIEAVESIKSVWRILAVFAFIPVFWALWDQSQSEWVIQATKMDNIWLGLSWEAETISFANSVLLLTFIPLFSVIIFPAMSKLGLNIGPLRKIGFGLIFTTLSFVIIAIIQGWVDEGLKPNIAWQLLAFTLLTIGEVLIAIPGLEYAYSNAPKSMKSSLIACWLVTITLSNSLVDFVQTNIRDGGILSQLEGASYFWFFSGFCGLITLIYFIVFRKSGDNTFIVHD